MWVWISGMASRKSDEAAAVKSMEMNLVPGKGNMPTIMAVFGSRSQYGVTRLEAGDWSASL
jgi:hypothetical protein